MFPECSLNASECSLNFQATVERLKERGVELEAVLDEGMMIIKPGSFPFINRHIALVGTAEKGFMSIQISTNVSGGTNPPPAHQECLEPRVPLSVNT
jgi:carboxypeptidase PM20D1